MIAIGRVKQLWLIHHRVDFRKQERSLLVEAMALGLDPYEGDLLLFIGRGKRTIKILYADPTGVWLAKKRFTVESMKSSFRFLFEKKISKISMAELALLIEGASYELKNRVKTWPKDT